MLMSMKFWLDLQPKKNNLSSIPHVVILGGGFGGLSAANEIRNSLDSSKVKITIIDKKTGLWLDMQNYG